MKVSEISRRKQLETILVICAGLVVIFFVTKRQHYVLLIVAGLIGLGGLLYKPFAAIVSWGWWKLSEILGRISSTIILTAVFFLLLTSVAWLSKLFGRKDSLLLKKKEDSYYFVRKHVFTRDDLENPW